MTEQENVEVPLNELLSKTRKARHLSVEEAAKSLNLSVEQLENLEDAELNLAELSPFERGYLRNYMGLLELDESLYEIYFPSAQPVGSQLKSMKRFQFVEPKPALFMSVGRFILILVILAAAGIAVWMSF
ncbi:MAG: helix-turn-helix domain-containing protein [Thiomicrorhabdus chilensis]|uniref:helix-turn-helix domain-containing protein n=1 Tax=Thiomicrorhabdus chilensis TaxID=63656 RepID=UPI00299EB436|nr:helix-turn-helix domain-containing protein [Thiomicrorhabdus chilensis]MDX1346742.1 helix-turn-helix domain-containing protein [Thiomicrorhabdus chilensis]